jgi:hypothetical protein
MGEIKFTQYLRPNGEKRDVTIERPDVVSDIAKRIIAAGYVLECEVLSDEQTCSFTIGDPREEIDVAIELCPNGPKVPVAVDKLITEFAKSRYL